MCYDHEWFYIIGKGISPHCWTYLGVFVVYQLRKSVKYGRNYSKFGQNPQNQENILSSCPPAHQMDVKGNIQLNQYPTNFHVARAASVAFQGVNLIK